MSTPQEKPAGAAAGHFLTLADGSGVHAELSVQITQVIREALPSLERADAEAAVVNAVRKDFDRKQLELLKSGKRQPVPVSSRHYDFKHNRLIFAKASDEDIITFIRRKAYWLAKLAGGEEVRVAEPLDVLYLNTTSEHMLALANDHLAKHGLITLARGWAKPTEKLLHYGHQIENETKEALHELEEKHRFEREGATHY